MMIKNILLVGLGGFLGSIVRYLTAIAFTRVGEPFPSGTFTINIIGCLAIGVIYGLAERNALLSTEWRLFLATGFCGGFTTFSTFAYENIALLEIREYLTALLYTGGSIVIGFAAAAIGIIITKQF